MSAFFKREPSRYGYTAISEEGSSFFIPNKIFTFLNLNAKQKLSDEEFNLLKDKVDNILCYEKGLSLLAVREHSKKELELKLLKKGFSTNIIRTVLSKLEEENSLSDYRYSICFVESRLKKKIEGKDLLFKRLLSKGVERYTAESAIKEILTDEKITELIIKELKKNNKTIIDEEELWHLRKLGFSSHDIAMYKDLM